MAAVLVAGCTPTVETRARSVSASWLALLDRGDFDEAWEFTARRIRSDIGRQRWDETVRNARNYGAIETRSFLGAELAEAPLELPPGDYIVVRYETRFAENNAVEVVILSRDSKEVWTVAGYYVAVRADRGQ